jgi:hypothetical protein
MKRYATVIGAAIVPIMSSNRLHDVISQKIMCLIVLLNAMCTAADVAHFQVIAVNSPEEAENL